MFDSRFRDLWNKLSDFDTMKEKWRQRKLRHIFFVKLNIFAKKGSFSTKMCQIFDELFFTIRFTEHFGIQKKLLSENSI